MDPASLLPKGSHNPDLRDLLKSQVTFEMISYITARATHLLKVADEAATSPTASGSLPTPPISPPPPSSSSSKGGRFAEQQQQPSSQQPQPRASQSSSLQLPSLEAFIYQLCRGSQVQPGTLLATLVYLDRLSHRLPTEAKGASSSYSRRVIVAGRS